MAAGAVVLKTIFSVLLTTDLVGNTLVILIILNNRSMKTAMNYLLLNLAVADMMVGVFFAPKILFMSTFTHPTGTAGDVLCKLITEPTIAWLAAFVSAFGLALIAIERFYAVVHPHSIRHRITKRKLKVLVPACWVVATVIMLPAAHVVFYDDGNEVCSYKYPEHWQHVSYDFLWLIASLIIPAGVMLVLYARVIHSLWFKNKSSDASRLVVIRERKRITKTMIIVSVIYILCLFPYNFLYIFHLFNPNLLAEQDWHFLIGYCFLVLNSSVNPLIYTFQFRNFRKCFKKLLCCKRLAVQQPSGTSSQVKDTSVLHPEEHATRETPM